MFWPHTFAYRIDFDSAIYGGLVWPFAELLGTFAATLVGLLSLWLARGMGHWFWRTIPVLFIIWFSTFIPAFDLGLVAGLQCIVVVIPLVCRRLNRSRFGLGDLLLAVVVFAAVLAFIVQVPVDTWNEWPTILWFGVGFGVLTLCGVAMASRKRKLGWRWMILIAVPYITPLVVWLRLLRHWLVHRTRRTAVALVALAGLVVSPIVAASLLLHHPAPLPLAAPPRENCLPTLCKIGASLPENLLLPYPNTAGKLVAALNQSAESLRSARAAMTKPGWVGVNYHLQNTDDFKERAPHRDPLVLLNNAFLAEGDLAVAEGRLGDGLDSYMDVLRLAQRSGVGGLPFDASLAVEFETEGMSRVHANVKKMTTEQCEAWIAALSSQEHAFEPAGLLRKRRYAWVDRIASWNDRLVLRYLRAVGVSLPELKLDVYERLRPTRIRLLITELALRRYLLDHGRYPDRLDELIPQYISSVPLDPFGRAEMVYRPQKTGYRLYSIGRDEADDGGTLPPHPYWFRQGDFTVDILEGP